MTVRNNFGFLMIAAALTGGCAEDAPPLVEAIEQNGVICPYCGDPNGTGVNIGKRANFDPLQNYFGFKVSGIGDYSLTGFTNITSGTTGAQSVQTVGWSGNASYTTAVPRNGTVVSATYMGVSYPVLRITSSAGNSLGLAPSPVYPIVWIANPAVTGGQPLYGSSLNGLTLKISIPFLTYYVYYDIIFSAPQIMANEGPANYQGKVVYGLLLTARPSGSANAAQPLCYLGGGSNELAMLYQGSAFNPMTAQRSDSPNSMTLTCKSGGIATSMLWGYTTWDTQGTVSPPLQNTHQAGIQMKRAAYNGDGHTYTVSGTNILKRDQLPIWNDNVTTTLEALWDQNGALCVTDTYRRHPEITWTNVNNLPSCSENSLGTLPWLTASGTVL